jgi:hypothetical protein
MSESYQAQSQHLNIQYQLLPDMELPNISQNANVLGDFQKLGA